jgi:hypothetical protein
MNGEPRKHAHSQKATRNTYDDAEDDDEDAESDDVEPAVIREPDE